jgi:hypothetical protein
MYRRIVYDGICVSLSRRGCRDLWKKTGVMATVNKMTPERLARIQKRLNKGESNSSVAKQEGVSEGSIRYMLKQGKLKKVQSKRCERKTPHSQQKARL